MKSVKKYISYFDADIFKCETLLSIACSYEDIVKFSNKKFIDRQFRKFIESREKIIKKNIDFANGFVCFDKNNGFGILWMKEFTDVWDNYEILVHELYHLVDYISEQKQIEEGGEARAYLMEYVFNKTRRMIQKEYLGIIK
jgi:hypothetical protein